MPMRRSFHLFIVLGLSLFLGACATRVQLPVELAPTAISSVPQERVGVAMVKLPKAGLSLPGADCLLCIMAAQGMNSALSKHTDSLASDDLLPLKEEIAAALRKKGLTPVVITEDIDVSKLADAPSSDAPNAAAKDFGPLRQKYGVSRLIVVQVNQLGFERTYASYFPTGDPKGVLRGVGYMVNGKNTYDWYQPVSILKAADGAWDEPAKYPGLTNAYFQAMEVARSQWLQPFAK
jgi:hypothetical protein